MTTKTMSKAREIYRSGGVEPLAPHRYLVTSTSGRDYLVNTRLDTCECPSVTTCSHRAAVELYRSARRKRLAAAA
jgi:hypothetical protein